MFWAEVSDSGLRGALSVCFLSEPAGETKDLRRTSSGGPDEAGQRRWNRTFRFVLPEQTGPAEAFSLQVLNLSTDVDQVQDLDSGGPFKRV